MFVKGRTVPHVDTLSKSAFGYERLENHDNSKNKILHRLKTDFVLPIRKRPDLVSYIDLRPGQKCHSKVMHRKEGTHSDGS